MEKLTKQQKRVLGWLLAGERITQHTGDRRGVGRVTSRIHDLRKFHGIPIQDRYITITKTTTGEKAKIKEYWMEPVDREIFRNILRRVQSRLPVTAGSSSKNSPLIAAQGLAPYNTAPPEPPVQPRPEPLKRKHSQGLLWEDVERKVGYG